MIVTDDVKDEDLNAIKAKGKKVLKWSDFLKAHETAEESLTENT